MTEYAYRSHRAVVTLAPGETKVFRLPPTTRGTVLLKALLLHTPGGGPLPAPRTSRDPRGATISTPPPAVRTRGSVTRERRTTVTPPPAVRAPRGLTRDHRTSVPDVAGGRRDVVIDHRDDVPAALRPRRPRVSDHILDGVLVLDSIDDVHDPLPGSSTPTDLTMELLLGGSISKQTHGHQITLQSEYVGEVWQLKLTRRPGAGSEQRYAIEGIYPSILPVLSREIPISAFQSAFDANWNQHPYVTIAMRDSVLRITFDEDFRLLYGLENYEKDLGWVSDIAIGSLPDFTCSVRFSMRVEQHPITVNGVRKAPVMVVDARSSIGPRVTLRFFLGTFGTGAGFVGRAEVRGISDNIPGVDVRAELEKAVQEYIDKLAAKNQQAFSAKFTPWLIGEPHRELLNVVVDDARPRFRVQWVGPRKPPSTEPVVSGGFETSPSEPRPAPTPPPYLFETPNETPPQGPLEPWEPRRPYMTSAGPLEVIQNVVVLMMENRSFDQVLGYLSREAGRTDVDGLSTDDRQHWEEFPDNIARVPHRAETTAWPGFDKPGPGHHTHDVEAQMGPELRMDKFVANFDRRAHGDDRLLNLIKAYFTPEQLPAYKVLTDEFAICDRWFTPHAGPTWPNRFITFTGDLNLDHSGQVEKDNPDLNTMTPAQTKTIFDHLTEQGHSWRIFEHGYSFLRLYGRYAFETEHIVDFRDGTEGFVAAARAGQLPKVTFIEPDYVDLPPGNDDHPPADMADGQRLIATVVKALLESPQWPNTMLIITYDEHGGFYDHVPPEDGVPLAGGNRKRGPRVPAFVVSPWVAKGGVSKLVYDHTTILSTILRTFCSPKPPRMSPRADAANDLRELVQATPRPRSDFDEAHRRLSALLQAPSNPARPPAPRLVANPERDDFHAMMRYVRSFT